MHSEQAFQPDWASSPGDTIADLLRQRGLRVDQLAEQLECSVSAARDLIGGLAAIDEDCAKQLETFLGPSTQFWAARESQYRQTLARLGAQPTVATQQEWIRLFPIGDMASLGWMPRRSSGIEKVEECLKFFGVANIPAWYRSYSSLLSAAAFRTSSTFESNPNAVLAWLRYAELRSNAVNCAEWNPTRFKSALKEIRTLTRLKSPSDFLPRLTQLCAASGVALVIARAPKGCRASGATRFLSDKKASIVLSVRYLSDDHFWFTFFHEAGHLLLHSKSALFIEDGSEVTAVEEREANKFAERMLIPDQFQIALRDLRLGVKDIIRFAWQVGVSPGIVVGQLQHFGRIDRNRLNSLKRRYVWSSANTGGN